MMTGQCIFQFPCLMAVWEVMDMEDLMEGFTDQELTGQAMEKRCQKNDNF